MKLSIRTASLAAAILLAGCSRDRSASSPNAETPAVASHPSLLTKSDSLSMKVMNAFGGHDAWAAVRYIRFDFAEERNGNRTLYRKNLWDRETGDYRTEYTRGGDATWVVLLNVRSKEGKAYLNGTSVAPAVSDSVVNLMVRYFVNDTYWLMAPVKLLEPGVGRLHLPGWSDENTDVITTTYANADLAPDDQFWFWIDKESGKLMRWAYTRNDNPSAGPVIYEWGDYESFVTDAGTIKFIPRKKGAVSDILTDNIAIPASVAEDAFKNPAPQL